MYPYHRLIWMILKSFFYKKKIFESDHIFLYSFRPGILDIDFNGELNNGRFHVFFDLARLDFGFRTGLVSYLIKNKLIFFVAGHSVRFHKRVMPFRKTQIRSQWLGYDNKFFYWRHHVVQNGEHSTTALVRNGMKNKDGIVEPKTILRDLGWDTEQFLSKSAQVWGDFDDQFHDNRKKNNKLINLK